MSLEKVKKIFPEIDGIKDGDLKEKVAAIWTEAMETGGWTWDDLDSIPFTLLIPDTPISLVKHTLGILKVSIQIADTFEELYGDDVKFNRDYLIAGAILHDVGKMLEYAKDGNGKYVKSEFGKYVRHPFSGAALAQKYDLPSVIIHMIATHAKEGDLGKRSVEGIIVNHADFVNFESVKCELK